MNMLIETYPYLDSSVLFEQVCRQDWSIYLDSGVHDGQRCTTKNANYDVLCIQPIKTLVSYLSVDKDNLEQLNEEEYVNQAITTQIKDFFLNGETTTVSGDDPFALLKQQMRLFEEDNKGVSGNVKESYLPGAYGYLSYDLAKYLEKLSKVSPHRRQQLLLQKKTSLPVMAMGLYSSVLVVDHRNQWTKLISLDGTDFQLLYEKWKKYIEQHLSCRKWKKSQKKPLTISGELKTLSQADYAKRFKKLKKCLYDGECYQANLTQSFSAKVEGDTWSAYQYLREISPAPYASYMKLPFADILSNSPESFIKCRDKKVSTSPIKGTRPRNHEDKMRDQQIAKELQESEKDKAENVMIVDLMRNDLAKHCVVGTVKTTKLFSLHSFSNVHHLISTIEGELKPDCHSLDLLRGCFPGGSITGAPKLRAMQIIEELESYQRGLYCGAITYLGMDGDLETNIAIRTMVVSQGEATFCGGGGIVFDSVCEAEYQELMDKVSMMKKAIGFFK